MKTIDNLTTEKWYYAQMFFRGPERVDRKTAGYCIVFANTPKEAEQLAKEYAVKNWKESEVEVHLYYKNYKREAKTMVERGEFIWD